MASPWDRFNVSDWPVRGFEQKGSTRNEWLEEPGTEARWLHKNTHIPENGLEQGEDWSEVVSTQVAISFGVPVAETRMCTRDGRRGSLSRSVRPEGQDLWEGSVVLESAGVPGYFPHLEGRPGQDPDRPEIVRPGHTLVNIRDALSDVGAPAIFDDGPLSMSGYDMFAGFMILDALIANRDRHEENWAVLAPGLLSETMTLSPSYDHASSLGFNLPDGKRMRCLADPQALQDWAEGGTAYRFEHVGHPRNAATLVDHAAAAVELCNKDGANWWRDRLMACDLSFVQEALRAGAIDGMSDVAAKFADSLLDLNLRRLRNAICNGS